jgi:hypothetical protein
MVCCVLCSLPAGALMPGSNGAMMMPGSSAAMQAASTSPNGPFMDLPAVSQPMAGQAGPGAQPEAWSAGLQAL